MWKSISFIYIYMHTLGVDCTFLFWKFSVGFPFAYENLRDSRLKLLLRFCGIHLSLFVSHKFSFYYVYSLVPYNKYEIAFFNNIIKQIENYLMFDYTWISLNLNFFLIYIHVSFQNHIGSSGACLIFFVCVCICMCKILQMHGIFIFSRNLFENKIIF